jgi:hypothetical protein
MASIKILNETFQSLGVNKYGDIVGTVQIDLGYGKIVTAKASPTSIGKTGSLCVAGFVGRYVTSPKPWLATVSGFEKSLYVFFGRDDRSGRFNKANAISFDPTTYATLCNPARWDAVEAA